MTDIVWRLTSTGQLALLVEASSPKPGNVSRVTDFSDMGYRHFLASSAMMARSLHECASRGVAYGRGDLLPEDIRLGELIHLAASDTIGHIGGKNTILGTILLYVPLVVALGALLEESGVFSIKHLRHTLCRILEGTTVEDSISLYESFRLANPGGTGIKEEPVWEEIHDRYDIDNPNVIENVKQDGISLLELFNISAPVDEIAAEWANGFDTVLNQVVPYLDGLSAGFEDLEEAVVRTYVWLLSRRPDGLIVKKAGARRAKQIMHLAESALTSWDERKGAGKLLMRLDDALRKEGNTLNPGTTADMISAAILCKLASDSFKNR